MFFFYRLGWMLLADILYVHIYVPVLRNQIYPVVSPRSSGLPTYWYLAIEVLGFCRHTILVHTQTPSCSEHTSLHNCCPRPMAFSEDDCQADCPRRWKNHLASQSSDCHTADDSTVWHPDLLSPITCCQTSYSILQIWIIWLEIIWWRIHCNTEIP